MPAATLNALKPEKQEASGSPDLVAIKARQQAAWSSGDYAVVGTTLQIVGEELCEALDLRSGRKVLDVAAGNGMVSLAAARRWCDVTSTDYVASLLERGRARASAEGLNRCLMSPPVMEWSALLPRGDGVMSRQRIMWRACWSAVAPAHRPKA